MHRWDESVGGPLCLETIRRLYQPSNQYRMSAATYGPGTAFTGFARTRSMFMLAGTCTIVTSNQVWTLTQGDIVDLPGGPYELRVSSASPVEMVSVWELPKAS